MPTSSTRWRASTAYAQAASRSPMSARFIAKRTLRGHNTTLMRMTFCCSCWASPRSRCTLSRTSVPSPPPPPPSPAASLVLLPVLPPPLLLPLLVTGFLGERRVPEEEEEEEVVVAVAFALFHPNMSVRDLPMAAIPSPEADFSIAPDAAAVLAAAAFSMASARRNRYCTRLVNTYSTISVARRAETLRQSATALCLAKVISQPRSTYLPACLLANTPAPASVPPLEEEEEEEEEEEATADCWRLSVELPVLSVPAAAETPLPTFLPPVAALVLEVAVAAG
mmetsp:Transcript_13016/g.21661  ORF Transcript_13016/g.21661 Transcript_13016/m.21661 type:complete len:281 (-) Transcript_13016:476-1318(-)